jgi:hypothetical protein
MSEAPLYGAFPGEASHREILGGASNASGGTLPKAYTLQRYLAHKGLPPP